MAFLPRHHPAQGKPFRLETSPAHHRTLHRARLLALAVPVVYAIFGGLWILVSDLVLASLGLPPEVATRIAMIKGWLYVAGSTLLIVVVMRKAWGTLEAAYDELRVELSERMTAQLEAIRLSEELDQRVRERTAHLQEALAELAMFSDLVSHDLRSPLRILSGYADALQESQASGNAEDSIRFAGRIQAVTARMGRMIQALMDFSRHGRESLRIETISPDRHQRMVDEIWHEVEQNHPDRSFAFRRGEFPALRGDASMLEHVWRNLLANAAKFTRERDPAVIEVEFHDGWFRVRDNGVGFDSSLASRMFRPFERLHPAKDFEGEGIGLALVGRVVERHGGKVEATGEPGNGCEVRFRLP